MLLLFVFFRYYLIFIASNIDLLNVRTVLLDFYSAFNGTNVYLTCFYPIWTYIVGQALFMGLLLWD